MLAVAGGAWALFGRDSSKDDTSAIGPKVPSATPTKLIGPQVPGATSKATSKATTTPTSVGPVAATHSVSATATATPKATPPAAVVATTPPAAPTAAPTKAPVVTPPATKPVTKPPVTAPQQGGTVAKKDYTFRVARGDTLWELTKRALSQTGRSTSNATVARYVHKLYRANVGVIGSDPNLILPGQTIVWPSGL